MPAASDPRRGPPAEALGAPSLLVALLAGVALVVATVVIVAVSGSAALGAVAVVLLWVVFLAFMTRVYEILTRTGVVPGPVDRPAEDTLVMPLSAGIDPNRLRSASITTLRDAHALQRGTRHFADAAAATIRAQTNGTHEADGVIELLEAQRGSAALQTELLEERLHALGLRPSDAADEEAIIAAFLYEHLLVRGPATNARHAFGLISLATATYALLEKLGAATGDELTCTLAERCRTELEPFAVRWSTSWDLVLDLDTGIRGDAHETMMALLEEVHDMEAMHASLLRVTAAHVRAAGLAAGVEDAGLPRLVALVDGERSTAATDRDLLGERLRALDRHPARRHLFETFAAARSTALVEHIRSYKLIRDIRDLLAADRLETASYDLLARAAERAGDQPTARLAQRLRATEKRAAEHLASELDAALEIALLNE